MQRPVFSLFFLAALAHTGPAFGQDAAGEAEIIVTASPLRQAQGDVLQGVTTLERADVVATLGAGLGETLSGTPGVASSFFGAGASRPIIRGLGEDRIRILSNGLGQVDVSAISPDHAVTTEGLEADRIEVLRGAAALAYGGNAVGGVVNVIDRRIAETAPEQAFSAGVYAGAAAGLDSAEAAVRVQARLGPIVAHVDGFTRDSSDYEIPDFAFSAAKRAREIAAGADPTEFARDAQPNSFARAEQSAFGLSLVGDRGFIGASVKQLTQVYGIPEAVEEEGKEEEAIFDGPRIDLDSTRTDLRAGLNAPFAGVKALRATFSNVDYAHTELEPSGEAGTRFSNEGWEARFELVNAPIFGFDGLIGVTALQTDFSALGEEAFITPTKTDDRGVFLVQQRAFGDWQAEGGVRYEQREYENRIVGDRSFDLGSASLGLRYKPGAWLFGATVARTQRAPTETELYSDGAHLATASFEIGNPNLGEETALSVEGTARWQGERFSVEAHLYRIDLSDYIALLADGTEIDGLPVFRFTADDATFTGGELTLGTTVFRTDALTMGADVSLDQVRAELDRAGNVPRMPPRSATLGVTLTAPRLGARVEWVHAADQSDVAAFETTTPGYDLINARLTLSPSADDKRLSFLIDARNLTDEDAREHSSFVKDLVARPGRSVRFAIIADF
jgi:iron complex outermembrane receptor protein